MSKRTGQTVCGVVLLLLVLVWGLGVTRCYAIRTVQPLQTQQYTRIPYFLLGAAVALGLCLMGVVRKVKSPLSLLPALVLGYVLAFVTKTPLFHLNYEAADSIWFFSVGGVSVLMVLTAQFAEGVFGKGDRKFDWKCTLKSLAAVAFLYVPSLVNGVFLQAQQMNAFLLINYWFYGALIVSGAATFLLPLSCSRAARVVLLALGIGGIAAFLLTNFVLARVMGENIPSDNASGVLSVVYWAMQNPQILSLSGIFLCAGLRKS